jgi:hypothetical protein
LRLVDHTENIMVMAHGTTIQLRRLGRRPHPRRFVYGYPEIAEKLGLPLGTIKARACREKWELIERCRQLESVCRTCTRVFNWSEKANKNQISGTRNMLGLEPEELEALVRAEEEQSRLKSNTPNTRKAASASSNRILATTHFLSLQPAPKAIDNHFPKPSLINEVYGLEVNSDCS